MIKLKLFALAVKQAGSALRKNEDWYGLAFTEFVPFVVVTKWLANG